MAIMMAASALFLFAPHICAQTPGTSPWQFRIDGGAAHQSDADLKDSEGSFALDRWFVGAGVDYAWNYRNAIGVSIGGGRSNYEWGADDAVDGFEPWDEIEDARVSATGRFGFGQTGTVFVIPTVRFNGEKGASSGDSRTYGLFAAAAWRIDENLTIGPGLGVFSRLEDSTRAFPILVIDWNIGERWNLSTGRGLAASRGPGLTLSYTLNPNWKFGLSGRYEDVEFRLDDEGPAPGGVGRDLSIPLVATAVLEPVTSGDSQISLSVFAGVAFGGKLKLKDALGLTVDESKYDPAALFGATFEFRF